MAIDYDSFRADIGDANGAFTDAEIDTLYARASSRYGSEAIVQEAGAKYLAVRQLMASASKLADYTANDASEKQSQVFKHLNMLSKVFKADLEDAEDDASGTSVRFGATRKKPSRRKEYPDNA